MITYVSSTSLFPIFKESVPGSYLNLDSVYKEISVGIKEALLKYYLNYSRNICKRHSSIALYRNMITNEYDADCNPFESATIISTYLVGYFSAVKSFTDAIGICLNEIYELNLSPINQDLLRNEIWNKLDSVDSEDYRLFKQFFEELKDWRNKSSHQLEPIVGVHGPTSATKNKTPDEVKKADIEIKLANIPGLKQEEIVVDFLKVEWVSPLHYLEKWDENIVGLSHLICRDIINKIKLVKRESDLLKK